MSSIARNKEPFIRTYQPTDEGAMIHVFRETASPDLRANSDPEVLHVGSFLWCRPYLLNPDWCLVLDDGNGRVVGYAICSPDTPKFVEQFKRDFLPSVKDYGVEEPDESDAATDTATQLKRDVYRPENMLHKDFPNLVKQYPAHLHIDILASHQGKGHGQIMIKMLLEKLKKEGISGVHLGMDAKNDRAVPFYERLGFEKFSEMKENGDLGRKGGGRYLAKAI